MESAFARYRVRAFTLALMIGLLGSGASAEARLSPGPSVDLHSAGGLAPDGSSITGRLGGDALAHFPWAWKESRRVAVRPVEIEVSHEPRRQWLRVRDHVTVRIRDASRPETVTCVIPGHEQSGEELVADELRVDDGPLRFEFTGNCGYSARFDYAG